MSKTIESAPLLNALCISDLQIPFEHQDALAFALHVEKTFFPEKKPEVINMGDEVDQHTLSKYASDPNGRSAGDEFHDAKMRLKPWFDAFPRTLVCESNHTYRVYKKGFDAGIPREFLRSIAEAYEAPTGWKWEDRHFLELGIEGKKVCFEHGEYVSGPTAAFRAAQDNRMCTVIGHQHTGGGVIYSQSVHDLIWGLNTGCLIDEDCYAFKYGRKMRKKPTLGMGVIFNGIPIFVPMFLNHQRRWVGRI